MSLCIIASAALAGASRPSAAQATKFSFPDPTFWRAPDGTWRATSTSLRILKSDDFFTWQDTGRMLFSKKDRARIRERWRHVWAPDAFKLGGEYLMYVALVNCATNSAIAVFASKSPDGPFTNGHIVTASDETGIQDTIDPEVVRDPRTGALWLFFGSTGKMHRVRLAKDGRSVAPGAAYEHVAGQCDDGLRDPQRLKVFEGAYLHRRGGWWYLFASRGCYWNHTYSVIVGRARTLAGPFRDRDGRDMRDGFATTVLSSRENDHFYGPGHNGEIFTIGERDYMPFHCHVMGPTPNARPLFICEVRWDGDGWPSARLPRPPAAR